MQKGLMEEITKVFDRKRESPLLDSVEAAPTTSSLQKTEDPLSSMLSGDPAPLHKNDKSVRIDGENDSFASGETTHCSDSSSMPSSDATSSSTTLASDGSSTCKDSPERQPDSAKIDNYGKSPVNPPQPSPVPYLRTAAPQPMPSSPLPPVKSLSVTSPPPPSAPAAPLSLAPALLPVPLPRQKGHL